MRLRFPSLRNPLSLPTRRPLSNPSAPPPNPKPNPNPANSSRLRARLQSFNNRLPCFLRPYTTPLLNAPVTHITSFLILHEITAIIPVLGLTGAFHYGEWIPALGDGRVDEGVRKFGRWLRRKGWVEGGEEVVAEAEAEAHADVGSRGENRDKGVRLILEFATAYAITKALLPVRIVLSVWGTPWFARGVLGPVGRGVGRVIGRKA
ncbi:hypothetical protein AJ79_09482 [Helicocarpus griseus UAMH5409]|uniref:Uncharacterized protein n=1 Tax=Helicocarpus griseus UAMH5409 TaxID=1447875 RepID=A0A2B7WJA6_9EURO|nr:hypothetical protein AJ79_09482 [Helicocarpus griseus UAMH5409]